MGTIASRLVGALGATVVAGTALLVAAGPATAAPLATTLAGAGTCKNIDQVYTGGDIAMRDTVERATFCLINAERRKVGAPPLRMKNDHTHHRGGLRALDKAANRHANDAASIRWWGPNKDPHTNPQTGKGPKERLTDTGYFRNCPGASWAENAYTGGGAAKSTPRAAVDWWMHSPQHKAALLDPKFRETGIGVAAGAADPALTQFKPGATFVETFGGACG